MALVISCHCKKVTLEYIPCLAIIPFARAFVSPKQIIRALDGPPILGVDFPIYSILGCMQDRGVNSPDPVP
jgi:hypothetical protein